MFSGADSFERSEDPKKREEFRTKLRQVRNDINNPCLKVGRWWIMKFHLPSRCKFMLPLTYWLYII